MGGVSNLAGRACERLRGLLNRLYGLLDWLYGLFDWLYGLLDWLYGRFNRAGGKAGNWRWI